MPSYMTREQTSCSHTHWVPVPNEVATYICSDCQVYGRRLISRNKQRDHRLTNDIVPWKDGKLREHREGVIQYTTDTGANDLTNLPKLSSAPKTKFLGETFIDPPEEK